MGGLSLHKYYKGTFCIAQKVPKKSTAYLAEDLKNQRVTGNP
ncbi:MAG: hypothetical protein PHQ46_01255 [Negativicutes bacterium]|nr:hypothetical protein [Negativicutes bacterium]